MITNKFILNTEEAFYISFGNKPCLQLDIRINDTQRAQKEEGEFQGLIVNSKPKFNAHIQHTSSC